MVACPGAVAPRPVTASAAQRSSRRRSSVRRGGVSARKLATSVGHSEGWVRTRLGLITLPDCALDALHDGNITLDAATALIELLDEPELIEELVRRPNLTVWQIESAGRQLVTDRAVAEALAELESTGQTGVTEDDWREQQRAWKTLDDLELDKGTHTREACQDVVVKAKSDGTVVQVPICTEPRRHRGRNPDSDLVVPHREPSAEQRQQQTDRRGHREAGEARSKWLTTRLTRRSLPATEVVPLAIATWIDSAAYTVVEHASRSLGLDAEAGDRPDHSRLLQAFLAHDPKQVTAVALALTAATCEERARHAMRSTTVARYLDTIERLGYEPTDWEHTQRLTAA